MPVENQQSQIVKPTSKKTSKRKQAGQRRALASCSGLWVLKSPAGKLVWQTLANHDTECHDKPEDAVWSAKGYSWVATQEGEQWQKTTWKKWAESITSAKKLGWSFVRVILSEDCPNLKDEPDGHST
jgi:hypothetical protein